MGLATVSQLTAAPRFSARRLGALCLPLWPSVEIKLELEISRVVLLFSVDRQIEKSILREPCARVTYRLAQEAKSFQDVFNSFIIQRQPTDLFQQMKEGACAAALPELNTTPN